MQKRMNRRTFLRNTAALSAASAFNIIPAYAAPKSKDSKKNDTPPPSEKLNLAIIGCSHQGGGIGKGAAGSGLVNVVALCDVVESRANGFKNSHKDARVYNDFRKMFDEMGNKIDACTVGVPDHAHFPISMLAMSLGKSVYVEKPLAHTFEECELLMAAEKKYKVACQMGNQGHSGGQRLQFKAWVEAGIIKNVRKVDACMNKGRRWHPWGKVTAFPEEQPKPEGMNWDVWCGTAPVHPYNSKYDPGNWRGWYDYGDGAFGDWGPHTLDTIHRFLKLGLPYEIRADKLEGQNDFVYPMGSTIAFEFAERGKDMPAMAINWYDGTGNKPPRPKELDGKRNVPACGKVMYSDDLVFMGGTHSSGLRIIPETKMKDMSSKFPEIDKGDTNQNHMKNFLYAAMGREECNSKFAVSGPLTQVFTLGCIAQRLGGTLKFDTKTKQITNNDRANALLKGHAPRKGWEEFYKLA
jgi:predicted dehydrogenase